MTLIAALLFFSPLVLILVLCFYTLRRPPDARARVIATKIMLHPRFPPQDLYVVHSAVLDLDLGYLRLYLKNLGPQ